MTVISKEATLTASEFTEIDALDTSNDFIRATTEDTAVLYYDSDVCDEACLGEAKAFLESIDALETEARNIKKLKSQVKWWIHQIDASITAQDQKPVIDYSISMSPANVERTFKVAEGEEPIDVGLFLIDDEPDTEKKKHIYWLDIDLDKLLNNPEYKAAFDRFSIKFTSKYETESIQAQVAEIYELDPATQKDEILARIPDLLLEKGFTFDFVNSYILLRDLRDGKLTTRVPLNRRGKDLNTTENDPSDIFVRLTYSNGHPKRIRIGETTYYDIYELSVDLNSDEGWDEIHRFAYATVGSYTAKGSATARRDLIEMYPGADFTEQDVLDQLPYSLHSHLGIDTSNFFTIAQTLAAFKPVKVMDLLLAEPIETFEWIESLLPVFDTYAIKSSTNSQGEVQLTIEISPKIGDLLYVASNSVKLEWERGTFTVTLNNNGTIKSITFLPDNNIGYFSDDTTLGYFDYSPPVLIEGFPVNVELDDTRYINTSTGGEVKKTKVDYYDLLIRTLTEATKQLWGTTAKQTILFNHVITNLEAKKTAALSQRAIDALMAQAEVEENPEVKAELLAAAEEMQEKQVTFSQAGITAESLEEPETPAAPVTDPEESTDVPVADEEIVEEVDVPGVNGANGDEDTNDAVEGTPAVEENPVIEEVEDTDDAVTTDEMPEIPIFRPPPNNEE